MTTVKTTSAQTNQTAVHRRPSINPEELAALGLNAIAYVRTSAEEEDDASAEGVTIHAANGERIGWAPSMELANAAIVQQDMRPLPVH